MTVIQEARMYIAHVSTIPFKAFNLMFPYLQHIGLNIEDCIGEQAYSYIIVRYLSGPGPYKNKFRYWSGLMLVVDVLLFIGITVL